MRSPFNQTLAVVAVALALGVLSASAHAQAVDINENALLLVAPAAMPAPVPVAAAPAALPVYEKVALDANVLFDSDKSTLRAAGRDALDRFVSDIHGLESRSIMAIGYADRRGSEASNQILSEERVDTVKAYLVSKGVATDRIQTGARGETRPSTHATECKDGNHAKNIACMQPDRRVFIQISGTRLAK